MPPEEIRDAILRIGRLTRSHNIRMFRVENGPLPIPDDIVISLQKMFAPHRTSKFFHSRFVLKLHLSGTSRGVVEERLYQFHPGDAFLIFPFQMHYIADVQGEPGEKQRGQLRLLINFDLPEAEQQILAPLKDKVVPLDGTDFTRIALLLRNIGNRDPQARRECVFAVTSLLMNLLEKATADQGSPPRVEKAPSKTAIAFATMCREYGKNPSLKSIASKLGYSENGLRQLFLRETGQTPGRLAKALRMRKALDLLLNSGSSVKQISRECGFSDPYNFSRAFKNTFHCSPTQYRTRRLPNISAGKSAAPSAKTGQPGKRGAKT